MPLTTVQILAIILAVSLGTQITRWLPFLLFPESKQPPKVVLYLGKVGHRRCGGTSSVEEERAAVHCGRYRAVYGSSSGRVHLTHKPGQTA